MRDDKKTIFRYALAWLILVAAAIVNGMMREAFYKRFLNELGAHQLSTITGMILLGVIIWRLSRRWPLTSSRQAWAVGGTWLVLTIAFEFLFGHFVAGHNESPVPFLTQHHDRITHVHVKDRKRGLGANMPFGEGDTPIIEVLRTIRDNRWPIQATIEFEYRVPAGSDAMREMAKCVAYCRQALES